MFTIEDETQAELQGDFLTLEAAIAELKRRAAIPWACEPNRAPCTYWKTCGRNYKIVEYGNEESEELRRIPALDISASGIVWHIWMTMPWFVILEVNRAVFAESMEMLTWVSHITPDIQIDKQTTQVRFELYTSLKQLTHSREGVWSYPRKSLPPAPTRDASFHD